MCLEMLVSETRSAPAMAHTGIGSFISSLRMSQPDTLEIAESCLGMGSRGVRFFAAGGGGAEEDSAMDFGWVATEHLTTLCIGRPVKIRPP